MPAPAPAPAAAPKPKRKREPKRKTKDVTITYQGLPCASVDISRSLSVDPDVATVDIAVADFNSIKLDDEAKPPSVSGGKLAQPETFSTTLSPEDSDPLKDSLPKGSPFTFKQGGTLKLGDHANGQTVVFNHMFISKGGIVTEESQDQNAKKRFSKFMRLELADERRFWKERGVVEGDYNIIDSTGVVIGKNAYRKSTLNGGKLWNLQQLIDLCVSELPSPRDKAYSVYKYNLASKIDQIYPELKCGGGRNAGDALDELLQEAGLYLSLLIQPGQYGLNPPAASDTSSGNIIVITERGQTDQIGWIQNLKQKNRLKPGARKLQPTYRPYGVRVTSTKRIIKETIATKFEAVIQDPDNNGKWSLLSDVALDMDYMSKQALKHFSEKEKGFLKLKKTNKALMAQLQQQAFKCYRMVLSDKTVLPMRGEVKISDDDVMTGYRPLAKCDYFLPSENKDPSKGLWDNHSGEMPGDKDPRFDLNAGVVMFPQPIGIISQQPKQAGGKGGAAGDPPESKEDKSDIEKQIDRKNGDIERRQDLLDKNKASQERLRGRIARITERSATAAADRQIGNLYQEIDAIDQVNAIHREDIGKLRDQLKQLQRKALLQKIDESQPIYSLEEAQMNPGNIEVTFQYESDDYWFTQIGDVNHSAVIRKDWEVFETPGYDNQAELVSLANAEALKLYSGRDRIISYEMEAVGFWGIVADGDRPRVAWRYNANGNFKPETLFQHDDFSSPFAGRPEVGYRTRVK